MKYKAVSWLFWKREIKLFLKRLFKSISLYPAGKKTQQRRGKKPRAWRTFILPGTFDFLFCKTLFIKRPVPRRASGMEAPGAGADIKVTQGQTHLPRKVPLSDPFS